MLQFFQREIFTGPLGPLFLVWRGPEVKQDVKNTNREVKSLVESLPLKRSDKS